MTYPISRYLNIQVAYSASFTADGTRINFVSNITGVGQVWQVALPGADGRPRWPDQLTFEPDRVQSVVSSRVPGDNRLIYFADVGGNENAQIYLLDPENVTETCLTAGHEDAMHLPGEWSQDGKRITFGANRRDKALFDLYVHDLETGNDTLLWENNTPGYLFGARFSPDGTRVLSMRYHSNADSSLFEIDIKSGAGRMVSPETDDVLYVNVAYANDGKSALLITDLDSDFKYLARLQLDSGTLETVYAADWDVEDFTLALNGRHIALSINEDGVSQLYMHDLLTGETRMGPMSDVNGVLATGFDFSADGTQVTFSYLSATTVADCYVWSIHDGAVTRVTRSSVGGLPASVFVEPELVHYPTFDKDTNGKTRHIPAWMFRPKNASGKLPVVVVVHGGPEGQSRPAFNFLIQYLVGAGYAVFVPNVRGSVGYGKAYSHLDDVRLRMDSVSDLAEGAKWLKKQPGIDGKRIVVYGGSYGGFMVLAAVTHHPKLWAAGVNIVGISNLVTFLENTSDYRRPAREAEYGTLADDRDFLEEIAPINHIDNVQVPLMVIHGANDPRVPLSEAEQLVAALETREVPVEFLVFDDEGHGVVKLKNKKVMYPAVVEFLDKYVK